MSSAQVSVLFPPSFFRGLFAASCHCHSCHLGFLYRYYNSLILKHQSNNNGQNGIGVGTGFLLLPHYINAFISRTPYVFSFRRTSPCTPLPPHSPASVCCSQVQQLPDLLHSRSTTYEELSCAPLTLSRVTTYHTAVVPVEYYRYHTVCRARAASHGLRL